jgi:hypothetical protein
MNRGVQRFIPIIFLVVIVGLIIAAGFSIFRSVTNTDQPTPVADTSNESLLSTSVDRRVRMTARGPIVGDEQFRTYDITVSPSKRDFGRYKGYLEDPLVQKTFENNIRGYDEFVHALSHANFVKGTELKDQADDVRGLCATGVVYTFELMNGESVVKHLWTTTCKGSKGSFVGSVDQIKALFLAQIPDVNQYIGHD